jgi:hypothetical protein
MLPAKRLAAFGIGLLFPGLVVASSFGPSVLVNTENFTIIDDAGGSGNVELRFGDTINEHLYWNAAQSRFEFTDDLSVQGNLSGTTLTTSNLRNCVLQTNSVGVAACGTSLTQTTADARYVNTSGDTMTGTLTIRSGAGLNASGTILTNSDITLNSDQGAGNATLTFGNITLNETLLFSATASRFEFSDDVHVTNNLSGSGTLRIESNVATKADLFINADNGANDAVLTFGNDTLPETLSFARLQSRFEFSDALHVTDTLSTSGALIAEGDVRLKSTLTARNVTYTFPGADGSGSGKMLATNAAGVLSWAEPVRAVTFTDATTESLTDANVDLWDGTYANISPRSTAKLVLVSVSIPFTADANDDEYNAFTMHRAIGANPTCASTQVGEVFYGSFTTNTGGTGQAHNTFLDSPASTGNVRYTVCSNTAATGTLSNDTQTIRFVLTEVGN